MTEPVSTESVHAQAAEAMSAAVETTPTPAPEEVTSTEVKTDLEPVVESERENNSPQVEDKNVGKSEEQINNLNKALAIEREERKRIEAELSTIKPTFEKMQQAFSPEPVVETAPEVQTEEQKFEAWYAQKEAEKAAILAQQQLQETIKTQITNLTNEWNGEGGKPKYDDNEVYKWQRENGKEYLTPEEAFFTMKQNDLIDWKAKQTLNAAPVAVNAERPSGISTDHSPTTTTPKTDQEIKNAVLEAVSSFV